MILHDNTVQVYQPPYYNDVSPPKRGFRVKSVDSGEEERRKIEGKQGFARRCSAAEIFGRYRARARSWILHGRDGPLSNSDRQLEGRSPLLELENERSERAPCKDRATRPSSLSAQLSHKFKAGRCLPPLSPLAHTRCNRNAMAGTCTDRYNRCSLRPDRPSAPPLNFCTTRASMIWSPLHTWVVHLRRSEFK